MAEGPNLEAPGAEAVLGDADGIAARRVGQVGARPAAAALPVHRSSMPAALAMAVQVSTWLRRKASVSAGVV